MEAVRTMKPKSREIRIRISEDDKARLQQAAAVLGVAVADFIRSRSLAAANSLQTECKQCD
jgi:uncharacterized protein (DUF1778 family)